MEGFTYVTALDLNMGYYTLRLDPSRIHDTPGCERGWSTKTRNTRLTIIPNNGIGTFGYPIIGLQKVGVANAVTTLIMLV